MIDVARELAHTLAAESQGAALAAQLGQMGRTATDEEIEAMAREQAEAMLEMLVQAGYVAEEGDRYVARLGYDGGRLTANGQPLALPGG